MGKAKTKFMGVYTIKSKDFTKGKIYEGYKKGSSFITDDNGYVYEGLWCNEFFTTKFVPLDQLSKKVKCISTTGYRKRFTEGEYYFVNNDGWIYDNNGGLRQCNLFGEDKFEVIEDYVKEEKKGKANKMTSLERDELVKGIDGVLVQDMFRAVTSKQNGMIQFNPVKMVHICFVRFNDNDKVYMFENPSDKRLKTGEKVKVHTMLGNKDAYVVSSLKIQSKYLSGLKKALDNKCDHLEKVVSIYETVEKPIVIEESK